MDLKFRVWAHISKPVDEVFEAVADPDQLSRYFTTGGAKGRMETGAVVTWDFHDFPGAFPVQVIEVLPNEKIILEWNTAERPGDGEPAPQYRTTVTLTFEAVDDDRTRVEITEQAGATLRPRSTPPMATAWDGRRCCAHSRCGQSTRSTCAKACTNDAHLVFVWRLRSASA